MTLREIIFKKIAEKGPISLSTFIKIVNTDPKSGYYTTKKYIFGKDGDFITSPELSSQFSKSIIKNILSHFSLKGVYSHKINLIELGPGNFRFIEDLLKDSLFLEKFSDITFTLVDVQKEPFIGSPLHKNVDFEFMGDLKNIKFKEGYFNVLIAHEFFDAIPTDLFYCDDAGVIYEILVQKNDTTLSFVQRPYRKGYLNKYLEEYLYINAKKGKTIEISREVFDIINFIGKKFILFPNSLGIVMDYGFLAPSEFSVRAILNHKFVDLFEKLDGVDFSVNVDFKLINELFHNQNSLTSCVKSQAKFLIENGILNSSTVDSENKMNTHRLLSPLQMGTIYKVLCVSS
jgi:NADH dehydrogenase [ubiquinone] 1 alpha subcomplex assembly factor 7